MNIARRVVLVLDETQNGSVDTSFQLQLNNIFREISASTALY